jgi:hypothetical protein
MRTESKILGERRMITESKILGEELFNRKASFIFQSSDGEIGSRFCDVLYFSLPMHGNTENARNRTVAPSQSYPLYSDSTTTTFGSSSIIQHGLFMLTNSLKAIVIQYYFCSGAFPSKNHHVQECIFIVCNDAHLHE